jgi:GDP-D-mannose 3',5'-epimerase
MKTALVLGGTGTIGGQLVKYLKKEGYWVRSVDIKIPDYSHADQFIQLDLRKREQCEQAILSTHKKSFDLVFMVAAQMGGAEFIFTKENDTEIIYDSAIMNLYVAKIAAELRVGKIFFSSSACVYPEDLQDKLNCPKLKEDMTWRGKPDSIYGVEKLFSESVYDSFRRNKKLNVRIARFHNVFSPECHYNDIRAKAPAAICHKVAKAYDGEEIEIFGDGHQQRSFLFIDEAIEGVMRLMDSDCEEIINIGSDEMISINNLAQMVIDLSGKKLTIKNIPSNATGVRGRNSDNSLIFEKLKWRPTAPLINGMRILYDWVSFKTNQYHVTNTEQKDGVL